MVNSVHLLLEQDLGACAVFENFLVKPRWLTKLMLQFFIPHFLIESCTDLTVYFINDPNTAVT